MDRLLTLTLLNTHIHPLQPECQPLKEGWYAKLWGQFPATYGKSDARFGIS